jgi:hypothetical protein
MNYCSKQLNVSDDFYQTRIRMEKRTLNIGKEEVAELSTNEQSYRKQEPLVRELLKRTSEDSGSNDSMSPKKNDEIQPGFEVWRSLRYLLS